MKKMIFVLLLCFVAMGMYAEDLPTGDFIIQLTYSITADPENGGVSLNESDFMGNLSITGDYMGTITDIATYSDQEIMVSYDDELPMGRKCLYIYSTSEKKLYEILIVSSYPGGGSEIIVTAFSEGGNSVYLGMMMSLDSEGR